MPRPPRSSCRRRSRRRRGSRARRCARPAPFSAEREPIDHVVPGLRQTKGQAEAFLARPADHRDVHRAELTAGRSARRVRRSSSACATWSRTSIEARGRRRVPASRPRPRGGGPGSAHGAVLFGVAGLAAAVHAVGRCLTRSRTRAGTRRRRLAQDVGDLAERGARPQRLLHRRQQVVGPSGGALDGLQRRVAPRRRRASARSSRSRSTCMRTSSSEIRCSSTGRSSASTNRLTPDDDPLARLDAPLDRGTPRRGSGPGRSRPRSRRRRRPSPRSGRGSPAPAARARRSATRRSTSRRAGRRRSRPRSRSRSPAASAARSSTARSVGSASASSNEFVCSDCVPPSTAAIASSAVRTMLFSRLLRGERGAARLRVEPQHRAPRVLRVEPLGHDPRPHPPRRAELRDLLEEVHVAREEERQPRREVVDRAGRRPAPPARTRCRSRA